MIKIDKDNKVIVIDVDGVEHDYAKAENVDKTLTLGEFISILQDIAYDWENCPIFLVKDLSSLSPVTEDIIDTLDGEYFLSEE